MPSILIIDRNSTIKSHNVKAFSEEELFKKAGFKNKEGFAKHTEWSFNVNGDHCVIELYGKTNGRAGQENKYEFPPPADKTLFFGSCVLVCKSNNVIADISPKEWEKVYAYLHGGFEDIDGESSETEDDDESDGLPRTKQGYVKDGFIVDDDAEDEEYTGSSADEAPARKTKPRKSAKTTTATASATKKKTKPTKQTPAPTSELEPEVDPVQTSISENVEQIIDEPTYLSCTDELNEEPYV